MRSSAVRKTLYLDSFVYAHIAKESSFAENVRKMIWREGYTLVFSTINLIEFLPNEKRWDAITDFIASVPFAIAVNPSELVDEEVRSYPADTTMPFGLISTDDSFSEIELSRAIKENLVGKIKSFRDGFVAQAEKTFEKVLERRDSGRASFTKPDEVGLFLMSNLLAMLWESHPKFVREEAESGREIAIQHFKSYTIQTLVIFEDYYQQKKKGQPSDVSDLLQIGYAPYVDLAVFDNAKVDTLKRIGRRAILATPVECQTLADFRQTCNPSV